MRAGTAAKSVSRVETPAADKNVRKVLPRWRTFAHPVGVSPLSAADGNERMRSLFCRTALGKVPAWGMHALLFFSGVWRVESVLIALNPLYMM